MRLGACKSFSREIDELKCGEEPSATARAHMQSCASCQGFYKDRIKLRNLIGELETVAAPGDFDFRLRARLANERGARAAWFPRALSFGLPSAALVIMAILLGVGFYLRDRGPDVTKSESPQVASPNIAVSIPAAVDKAPDLSSTGSEDLKVKSSDLNILRDRGRARKANRNSTSVMKRDDFLARSDSAAMFPLEAAEPLRVSVDYTTGGSRTISVPAVSFGSQQVVARGASMMKTSARTVW